MGRYVVSSMPETAAEFLHDVSLGYWDGLDSGYGGPGRVGGIRGDVVEGASSWDLAGETPPTDDFIIRHNPGAGTVEVDLRGMRGSMPVVDLGKHGLSLQDLGLVQ